MTLNLTKALRGDVVVLQLEEARVDARHSAALRDALVHEVDNGRRVIVDLSATEFMDSTALAALIAGIKCAGRLDRISLVGVHGAVTRLFTLTRMDRVFALHATTDAALAQAPA